MRTIALFCSTIFFLSLIALPIGATPYCSGLIPNSSTKSPSVVSNLTGSGCTLNANKELKLNATGIPSNESQGIVLFTFVNGTVQAGGYIEVTGPSATVAAARVALVVLISNNQFYNGSAVLVTGSFPPGSNISLSYNHFVSSTPCTLLQWRLFDTFVTVIVIADVLPIELHDRAEINVQHNNIQVWSSVLGEFAIPFIVNAITFHTNVTVSIQSNNISAEGKSPESYNTWILFFNEDSAPYIKNSQTLVAYFRFLGIGSRWAFDDNWIKSATISTTAGAFVSNAPVIIDSNKGGTFSFSRNYLIIIPFNSSENPKGNPTVDGTDGNSAANFTFFFVDNTFELYNIGSYLDVSSFNLSGHSQFVFANNNFYSMNASAGIYITFLSLTLQNHSALIVTNNTFATKKIVNALGFHALNFENLTLADAVSFSLVDNSIDAASDQKLYSLNGWIIVSPTANIFECGTRCLGTRLNKLTFGECSNSAFFSMPIHHCAGTQTSSASGSSSLSATLSGDSTTITLRPVTPSSSVARTITTTHSKESSTESMSHLRVRTSTKAITVSRTPFLTDTLTWATPQTTKSLSATSNCTVASDLCARILLLQGSGWIDTCGQDLHLPEPKYYVSTNATANYTMMHSQAVSIVLQRASGNAVDVQTQTTSNLTSVLGQRHLNGSLVAIDITISPLTLSFDGSPIDSPRVGTVNVSFVETCDRGRLGGTYWRILSIQRPVSYLPRRTFERDPVAQDTATVTGIISVTIGAIAVPIGAVQQGVALALVRMAQCEEDALSGEELDVLVHPLQFRVGEGPSAYGRGAVIGNLVIIPVTFGFLSYLAIPLTLSAVTGQSLVASRTFIGWPAIAISPITVLSEGSAMATVALLASQTIVDIFIGAVGSLVLIATVAIWVRTLWLMRRLRGRELVCLCEQQFSSRWWLRVVHARYEWSIVDCSVGTTLTDALLPTVMPPVPIASGPANEAVSLYLAKRLALIGSSWWLWSALVAHCLSLLVGAAEGVPVGGDRGLCMGRWAIAGLAAICQLMVVMTNSVPAELFLLGVVGILTCVLIILVTLSTFGLVELNDTTVATINAVGTTSSVVGILLTVTGVITGTVEVIKKRRRQLPVAEIPLVVLTVPAPAPELDTCITSLPDHVQQSEHKREGLEQFTSPSPVTEQVNESSSAVRWAAILLEAQEASDMAAARAKSFQKRGEQQGLCAIHENASLLLKR